MSDDRTAVRTPATWKTIAVFTALGPVIGSLVGFLVIALTTEKINTLTDAGLLLLLTLLFGYLFGVVPAALTGVGVAAVIAHDPNVSTARRPAIWGAIWGALWAGLAGLAVAWLGHGGGVRPAFTIAWFAGMGAAAGFVCGRLVRAGKH